MKRLYENYSNPFNIKYNDCLIIQCKRNDICLNTIFYNGFDKEKSEKCERKLVTIYIFFSFTGLQSKKKSWVYSYNWLCSSRGLIKLKKKNSTTVITLHGHRH